MPLFPARFARERRSSLASWTPADLTNIRGWYRADTVVLVGSDVDQWTDQSGVGNHLTAASAGVRPLHIASAVNGQPAVSFDGSVEWLRNTAFGWGASVGAHTIGLVARITTFVALDRWVDYAGAIVLRSGASNILQGNRTGVASSSSTTALGTSAYHPILYTWSGSSQSIYVGGVAEDTDANAGSAMADSATLGIGQGGSLFAAIDVAEAVVMRAEMTAGERADWASYVSARYGV